MQRTSGFLRVISSLFVLTFSLSAMAAPRTTTGLLGSVIVANDSNQTLQLSLEGTPVLCVTMSPVRTVANLNATMPNLGEFIKIALAAKLARATVKVTTEDNAGASYCRIVSIELVGP